MSPAVEHSVSLRAAGSSRLRFGKNKTPHLWFFDQKTGLSFVVSRLISPITCLAVVICTLDLAAVVIACKVTPERKFFSGPVKPGHIVLLCGDNDGSPKGQYECRSKTSNHRQ